MAEELSLQFPFSGLSDAAAFGEQEQGTSRDLANVRGKDPITGRMRGAQRAGHSPFVIGRINGATKVEEIISIPYHEKLLTYSTIDDVDLAADQSAANPTNTDTLGAVTDRQSNLYILDGPSGIAKYNSEFELLWKHSLPVKHPKHVVRALFVDEFDGVYAGTSTLVDSVTGATVARGESLKAGLWKVRQLPENGTEMQWEVETKGWVNGIKRKGPLLYTIQNFPESGQAFLVVYQDIDTATPVEAWRKELAYPMNDLAVGPKDGSIFIACEPNATRGIDPRVKHSTQKSVDFTPLNLPNYAQRIWHWHDFSDTENLTIKRKSGSDSDDGGEILISFDKSGKGRHLYAAAVSGDKGPTWRTVGSLGGLPSARFNGLSTLGQTMISSAPTSLEPAQRDDQVSFLPSYKGAQFVLCMAVQTTVDATPRWLVSFGDAARAVITNRDPGTATVARPGSMVVYEAGGTASTAASTITACLAPAGTNGHPLGQSVGPNGQAILTWICDGGVHDVFGSATRSTLRVNGRPADRWQSAAFSSLNPTMLGYGTTTPAGVGRFAGEIVESVCLSDWVDPGDIQQRLVTMPEYPDSAWAFAATSTELEQIEGYLAHRCGIAHLLPGGRAGSLIGTTVPSDNEQVILGSVTYTWKTALTAAPVLNEVLIGASLGTALLNHCSAINHTGNPGVDYSSNTVPHPDYFCFPPVMESTTAFNLQVRSRSSYAAAATTTDTWFGGEWNDSATDTDYNFPSANRGHYPHPHHLNKTTSLTLGGPPDSENLGQRSSIGDVNLPYGMLIKCDPANGNVKWIAASNYNNTGIGIGGVGYGCVVNSAGDIYSVGPTQAAVTGPAINADAFNLRKIVDSGDTFNISTTSSMLVNPWRVIFDTGVQGALTEYYHYPRMAVDKYDNLYVPWNALLQNLFTVAHSMLVYQRASAGDASIVGVQIAALDTLADLPAGYAVAVDPQTPDYEADLVLTATAGVEIGTRAKFVYLATNRPTATNRLSVFKLKLVSEAATTGTPRAKVNLAVAGTSLFSFTNGGAAVSIGMPFSATSQFIDSTVLFQKAYFTDGVEYWAYSPKAVPVPTLEIHKATSSGQIPKGCKLISNWRGRLIVARDPSNPHAWHMAKQGDPKNWDFFPPVFTDQAAVSGQGPRIGVNPDIVNAIAPISNEVCMIGGNSTIYAMLGDPAVSNSSINLVTDRTGMSFGPSWDMDENGRFFFSGSRGGIYTMTFGEKPTLISEKIDRRLRDIDFSTHYVQVLWYHREGLRVLVLPYGEGGSHVKQYCWEPQFGAWFEDEVGTENQTGLQPTCAYILDGDTVSDRRMLIGTEDGQIMVVDESATSDGTPFGGDEQRIDSRVLIGPNTPPGARSMYVFRSLKAVLSDSQDGCNFEWFASETPDVTGDRRIAGRLEAGQNPIEHARIRGAYIWLRLRNAALGERWALESLSCKARSAGRSRVA